MRKNLRMIFIFSSTILVAESLPIQNPCVKSRSLDLSDCKIYTLLKKSLSQNSKNYIHVHVNLYLIFLISLCWIVRLNANLSWQTWRNKTKRITKEKAKISNFKVFGSGLNVTKKSERINPHADVYLVKNIFRFGWDE